MDPGQQLLRGPAPGEPDGAPWGIRTLDLLLRRQLLYPTELKAHMERVMGIEPTRPAWKAGILPLNYTRTSPSQIACLLYHIKGGLSRAFLKKLVRCVRTGYSSPTPHTHQNFMQNAKRNSKMPKTMDMSI